MAFSDKVLGYLEQYRAEHTKLSTRITHMIGIPMIVASLPLIPTVPPVGLGMFTLGWGLQFLGHYFEGNKPAFYSDPLYLAVGPVWVAIEWIELLSGRTILPSRTTDATA
jgi:uncharacterized membrane protein YGL010W